MKDSFYFQWHITNLCNLRCKHCYQDDFSKKSDLDWAGLKKVSDNVLTTMREWGQTACIHLTGGEPLLKPELFPLLNDLDQQSVVEELGIITNGLLIDQEMMRKLFCFSKLKKIKISLDGGDAKTNDLIRQKGAFEEVMQNLSLIKKEKRFEIILMFTVMKKNFKSLPSLFKLCQDLGIDGLIIERFIPLGKGKESLDEVLSKEEWKEMIEMLLDFFPIEGEEHSLLPYQAFQISFNGEEPELLGAPCVIGVDGLCIMPEGIVFPCRRFPISIGNLLETPLKQIWEESEMLRKLRRKENLKGKCGSCEIKDCRGCRSLALALTGDYLEQDPHCWYTY
ncbi:MAG: radical SAM/SPASM domain-containing protein [Deltaproteobacteria bacterium CG_4_8_14_3_um_filter_45_9]|nr:MAG: radical SAM/SPASM domain-containing protein [Deltaproteobacteria bacterium CG03_land_8_20_14_0_80_45_14]PIX25507.1 MAG: radical SAM/SPASM domain-containing protein [Deltaproteobacteria bacterium CG_4_8_14_3_um_filter_45_9]